MRHGLLAAILCASLPALADGAFPNGMSVFAPAATPHRLLMGTTFGLVISDDDGATWHYVCEPYVTGGGEPVVIYAATADGAILAAHSSGVARSTDGGCGWSGSTGALAGQIVTDVFADPHDASLVLAAAYDTKARQGGVFPSHDGGRTFAAPLLSTPAAFITGVELSASSPGVIYATAGSNPGNVPNTATLLRSADGGASWTSHGVPITARGQASIAAVDPEDASTVYLRTSDPIDGDQLLITADGGRTISTALQSAVPLTGFLRAPDRTLYAATLQGAFFRRAPGAAGFSQTQGPHVLCLGARGAQLLACADGVQETFNLAASDDGGKSFRPLLDFRNLQGPATCAPVQTVCAADWRSLQQVLAFGKRSSAGGCHCGSAGEAGLLAAAALWWWSGLRRRRTSPA